MKNCILYSIFFLHTTLACVAQQPYIDSVEKQLTTTLPDTTRALSMMRLAVQYETVDTFKSMRLYNAAIAFALSKKLNYHTGLSYFNQSFLYSKAVRYEQARIALDSALYYFDRSSSPEVTYKKALVYGELANNARFRNEPQLCIEYNLKKIAILEKLDRPSSLLIAFLNVSTFYKEQNEFLKEEEYARKGLAMAKRTGLAEDYFKSYVFVALALNMQNRYAEARSVIDSCVKYYSSNNGPDILLTYNLTSGLTYMNLNLLDSANASYRRALAVAESNMAAFGINQSKLQLGRILTMQKKYGEAEKLLIQTTNDIKATNENAQLFVALDYLSRLYDESGDYKKALTFYKEFKAVSDSMASEENRQYASSLEVKYEAEKKETQIKQLVAEKKVQDLSIRQKKLWNYVLVGAAVILLIITLLSYRTYRQKQKIQQQRINELETEKKLTATEAVLKGEEQERTRLAKDLHDGLGGMLSGIKYSFQTMKGNLVLTPDNVQAFERSMDMLDSSIKEMRRVAHNMMPEALVKFGLDTALKDFCGDINSAGVLKVSYQSIGIDNTTMPQTTAITIYRIIQELMNNTMKHARAKAAIVQVTRTNNQLAITVEDDGVGFDTANLSTSKGMGWDNIQKRVEFLNGKLDVHAQKGKGTSVLIELTIA